MLESSPPELVVYAGRHDSECPCLLKPGHLVLWDSFAGEHPSLGKVTSIPGVLLNERQRWAEIYRQRAEEYSETLFREGIASRPMASEVRRRLMTAFPFFKNSYANFAVRAFVLEELVESSPPGSITVFGESADVVTYLETLSKARGVSLIHSTRKQNRAVGLLASRTALAAIRTLIRIARGFLWIIVQAFRHATWRPATGVEAAAEVVVVDYSTLPDGIRSNPSHRLSQLVARLQNQGVLVKTVLINPLNEARPFSERLSDMQQRFCAEKHFLNDWWSCRLMTRAIRGHAEFMSTLPNQKSLRFSSGTTQSSTSLWVMRGAHLQVAEGSLGASLSAQTCLWNELTDSRTFQGASHCIYLAEGQYWENILNRKVSSTEVAVVGYFEYPCTDFDYRLYEFLSGNGLGQAGRPPWKLFINDWGHSSKRGIDMAEQMGGPECLVRIPTDRPSTDRTKHQAPKDIEHCRPSILIMADGEEDASVDLLNAVERVHPEEIGAVFFLKPHPTQEVVPVGFHRSWLSLVNKNLNLGEMLQGFDATITSAKTFGSLEIQAAGIPLAVVINPGLLPRMLPEGDSVTLIESEFDLATWLSRVVNGLSRRAPRHYKASGRTRHHAFEDSFLNYFNGKFEI